MFDEDENGNIRRVETPIDHSVESHDIGKIPESRDVGKIPESHDIGKIPKSCDARIEPQSDRQEEPKATQEAPAEERTMQETAYSEPAQEDNSQTDQINKQS